MTQTRQPQGVPSGGQFAARTHAEVDIELTGKGFALAIGDVAEGDHVQPNMYVGEVSSVGETTTVELVDRDGRPIGSVSGGPETKLSYFAGGRSASVERMAEGSLTGDEPAGDHLDRDRQWWATSTASTLKRAATIASGSPLQPLTNTTGCSTRCSIRRSTLRGQMSGSLPRRRSSGQPQASRRQTLLW